MRENIKVMATNDNPMTPFGRLLKHYMDRQGMSDEQFAKRMVTNGYPNKMGRTMVQFLRHNRIRVYPEFFEVAQHVLELTDEETEGLVKAWWKTPSESDGTTSLD